MKQSQIKQIYDKYLWEKCSITIFYKRIRQGVDPFKAVLPVKRKQMEFRSTIRKDELERRRLQPEPKATREKFYWRLQKGRTKEEALPVIAHREHIRKIQTFKAPYIRTYAKLTEKKAENIDIRYSEEEAEIFKKEYERMIHDVENELFFCEEAEERHELKTKLSQIQSEFNVFISYNTKIWTNAENVEW